MVREQITVTSAPLEEQTTVTHGITSGLDEASTATSTLSANLCEIVSTARQLVQAVAKTTEAATAIDR